jgi:ribonucleoside-diphosphate reductase beta chain
MTTSKISNPALRQYDFSFNPSYQHRKMVLDPNGPVTVQRFDDVKYPKLEKYEQMARGFFWVPEEISLTKDKIDFKEASDAVKHIFTSNLLRQTALDSIQGRSPTQVFTPICSVPELEALCLNWGFFETNIHSRSYAHIIKNIYNVSKDQFDKIHDTQEIVDMASSIGKYYNELYVLNCKQALGEPVDEMEHCKAVWLALNASYGLEAIRFMVSFATSLGMVENKIFIGNGNIISLILQDELLHTEWTAYILNQVVKDDERFAQLKEACRNEVYELYMAIIAEEKAWAHYLFQKGPVIGMNAQIMIDFVEFTAAHRLNDIGIKYKTTVRSTPLPWFNKHVNINKKQAALQETESVSYVIGVMSDAIEYDQLPDLE